MSSRARAVGWAVGMALVVALVAVGARQAPTEGRSDDRLYALAGQMKCLQCAGESVAGSQADIAVKMRAEIRSQMDRGRTDAEILDFFAERYGERVLLNPSGDGVASLVWVIPVVGAGLAAAGLATVFAASARRRRDAAHLGVSEEDRRLVDELLSREP